MITPLFDVSQDDKYVVLEIRVPYMKASTFDYYIIGSEFKFYAKPYFLRLTFPHPLDEEGGHEKLAYDISNGILTVHLPKATPGQFFENLGMITQLLAKKKPVLSTAPVQIVSSGEEGTGEEEFEEEEEEEIDMEVEQTPAPELEVLKGVRYGFNNQYSGFFSQIQEETSEIVELPCPDTTPASERRELRILTEDDKFDPEHYMADFVMDETIKELIQFEPHWIHEKRKYRELKRQHFGQRVAVAAATGEQQPAAAAAQDNDDVNEKEGDEQEKKQSAAVEKLDVRPSSAAPRIIMLKTNKEKEDEERKAAAAAKKTESEETSSSSHLQPFPFGGGGSRPLVQEIGPGGYRPAASSTLRPLIQEISSTSAAEEDEDKEDEIIDVAREMKAVSIKRITGDQPASSSSSSSSSASSTSAPVQLQIQPKTGSAGPSLPSGFILSSSSSSSSSSSTSTSSSSTTPSSLIMEIDAKKETTPIVVVQQEQPSASLPAEVTGITAASSATATSVVAAATTTSATTAGPVTTPLSPFASMSFDVPSPHQRGEGFPFSPQLPSAPLTSSASLPTSPFTFSSPGAATQVPPALVFGAAPATTTTTTTPAAPAATPLAKPAPPSLVQAAVAKRAPKREGKGKMRPAKTKEQVKEEMRMRSAIEEKVIEWTQDEKETMLRLPRKEYLLENEKATLLGLIDLVFAYAYNQRTTMDEPTCESDWTITNISPTLSWLETFGGIGQTLTACVRRSLVYPLYRHWGLALTVMADVVTIFSMGKRSVLRALLGVKRILDRSDPRFYHCKLFVDDYCVWLQAYSNHRLRALYGKIKEAVALFDKEDVEWPLDELEREAPEMVMDVEPDDEAPQHL